MAICLILIILQTTGCVIKKKHGSSPLFADSNRGNVRVCTEVMFFTARTIRASNPSEGKRFLSSQKRPDHLQMGWLGGQGVKLTTHISLMPRLRMRGAKRTFPLYNVNLII